MKHQAARHVPLSRGVLHAYAAPAAAMALPTLPVYVLLPAFYAENTALTLLAVGSVLFAVRLIDAGSDLLAGRLCDIRLGTLGRRRGWMLIGALLLAPGLLGLFAPPSDAGVVWLAGFSLLLYLGWTMVQVPYLAWGADLSKDYRERVRLTGHREALGLVGLVLSAAWPAAALWLGYEQSQAFVGLAVATLILGSLALAWLWRVVPEPVASIPDRNQRRGGWLALWRDRLWSRLMLAWLLNAIANGVAAVLFPFFVSQALDLDDRYRALLLLVYFASAVLAMPILMQLGKRYSKHRLWSLGMLCAALVFAFVPLLGPGDLNAFLVICVLTGLALGSDLALPPALLADVVDWDRWRNRRERPAMFFAVSSFVTKMALGVAVLLAPLLLAQFGWQETADSQNDTALLALALVYAGVPCVLKLVSVGLIWNFPLNADRYRTIRARLDRWRPEAVT